MDHINAPHFTTALRNVQALSAAAQAETKRQNEAAAQRHREAAAIGAELDPDALEQGDIQ
jgi:hypothetical protein